jgi:hypothetical protein
MKQRIAVYPAERLYTPFSLVAFDEIDERAELGKAHTQKSERRAVHGIARDTRRKKAESRLDRLFYDLRKGGGSHVVLALKIAS